MSRENLNPFDKPAAEAEESMMLRQTTEYRDKDGNLEGSWEMVFSPETVKFDDADGGNERQGKVLLSFVVKGPKGTCEVLSLPKLKGVKVVVVDGERLMPYSFFDAQDFASSPQLNSPSDIGICLHELGHAEQYSEDYYRDLYEVKPWNLVARSDVDSGDLPAIFERIPKSQEWSQFIEKGISNIENIGKEEQNLLKRLSEAKEAYFKDKIDKLKARSAYLSGLLPFSAQDLKNLADDNALSDDGLRQSLERFGFTFMQSDWNEGELRGVVRQIEKQLFNDYSSYNNRHLRHLVAKGVSLMMIEVSMDHDTQTATCKIILNDGGVAFLKLKFTQNGQQEFIGLEQERIKAEIDGKIQLEKVESELMDLRRNKKETLDDLIRLPARVMERDATKRALLWMRKIKQMTGVDLLRGENGALKFLEESYCSYGAKIGKIRTDKSTDKGLGRPFRKPGATGTLRG